MATRNRIGIGSLVVVAACLLLAADQPKQPGEPLPHVQPPAALERLKQLVGRWEGTEKTPEGEKKVAVEYRLTAAGTAVVERLFPGQEHEMHSIYHGDGSQVLMTHYCALGNQPRMRLEPTDDPKVLKFVFQDGTSMKSPNDPHMHQLTMTFEGEDRLTHEWVFFADGRPANVVRFDLKRRK